MSFFDPFMAPIYQGESAAYTGALPPPVIIFMPVTSNASRVHRRRKPWLIAVKDYLEMKLEQ